MYAWYKAIKIPLFINKDPQLNDTQLSSDGDYIEDLFQVGRNKHQLYVPF